jgi:hypothetical protein
MGLGLHKWAAFGVCALVAVSGCAPKRAAEAEGKTFRVATFNAYLNRPAEGRLIADLSTPDNAQAKAVAEIIQRVAPDVVLLQEVDYDSLGRAVALFQENYLFVSQNGAPPITYEYLFVGPTNTGEHSGFDLDNDGVVTAAPGSREYGGDAIGYGEFPGQYGMALLSKYPLNSAEIRTFRKFLWKDMPGAKLPDNPATAARSDWYSQEELGALRLSSKSHWDVPILVDGKRVHILAAHPTPPVFDGPEDRNGVRNYDEVRLWADYVTPGKGGYVYDDEGGKGGLAEDERFVILGDYNADPLDGDGLSGAIGQLLGHPAVNAGTPPQSAGAKAAAEAQAGANAMHQSPAAQDTADFGDDPEKGGSGNLHLDYVLPSKAGLAVKAAGVFWPSPEEEGHALVGSGWPVVSSDHRLVWVDLEITD